MRDYGGLWGLDTRDRYGGERAPSGPRYERDGSVRSSWANPLGWAGLLKIPSQDNDVAAFLAERVAALELELGELDVIIDSGRAALRRLRAEVSSLQNYDNARSQTDVRRAELAEHEAGLNQTIATRTRLAEERRAHLATLSRPLPPEPPQAHISKPHRPHREEQERRKRFLELWAVVSTPLLLVSVVVALTASPKALVTTIVILAAVFMGMEAIARRRFVSFLTSTVLLVGAIVLSVALIFLFLAHWRIAVSVLIGAAALVLLIGNLLRG